MISFIVTTRGKNNNGWIDRFQFFESQLIVEDTLPPIEFDKQITQPKYFGQVRKDSETGFEGVVDGRLFTLFAEDQYRLQPKVDKDGNIKSCMWVDDHRIEPLPEDEVEEEAASNDRTEWSGGPAEFMPSSVYNSLV